LTIAHYNIVGGSQIEMVESRLLPPSLEGHSREQRPEGEVEVEHIGLPELDGHSREQRPEGEGNLVWVCDRCGGSPIVFGRDQPEKYKLHLCQACFDEEPASSHGNKVSDLSELSDTDIPSLEEIMAARIAYQEEGRRRGLSFTNPKEKYMRECQYLIEAFSAYYERIVEFEPQFLEEERSKMLKRVITAMEQNKVEEMSAPMFGPKRARTGELVATKQQRLNALKEDIHAALGRLHQNPIPQYANLVREAQRVVAGGDFTSILQGKTPDELTEVVGSVSGSTPLARYRTLKDNVYEAHVATTDDIDTQNRHAKQLLVSILEMAVTTQFANAAGVVSWENFTKKVTKLSRGDMED
jgi:hypothetical protein